MNVKEAHTEDIIKKFALKMFNVFQIIVVMVDVQMISLKSWENLAHVIIIVKLAIAAFLFGFLVTIIDALKIK